MPLSCLDLIAQNGTEGSIYFNTLSCYLSEEKVLKFLQDLFKDVYGINLDITYFVQLPQQRRQTRITSTF